MVTQFYTPGQRVVAPAEPQLGLGVVTESSGRRFQVLFAKVDLQRTYSVDTGAVHRFRAKPGDTITTQAGIEHVVRGVVEREGLLIYLTTQEVEVPELVLSPDLGDSDPFSALAVGRPGSPAGFLCRGRAYGLRALGRAQEHRGLGSARVELLPHQLYVAERVSQMWRPRVLLADEVGLGKTVEAGLISVRLGALGRAQSLAVVAPRALVGQWLAEFYRRFARPLTLFDPDLGELPQDLLIAADDLEFLPGDFERELLIVDEAHHYFDDESLKVLAARSSAVLFLTATPSLGGQDSLFALLHQLDPLRYPDSDSLRAHGEEWAAVADLARRIEENPSLSGVTAILRERFPTEKDLVDLAEAGRGEELLQRLVDRHGLGRSLIRNRRARLQELFCGREVVAHRLDETDEKEFLVEFLRRLKVGGEKALVMVSSTAEVSRWARFLAKKTTLSVARFDETMSLLERDRQAAWFNRVDTAPGEEEPASVMLCSELGGEGRNFQVAHHLVLLDLPLHPDKLEQRIGRLDRIGQRERVIVHVPLPKKDVARALSFRWLNEGLDAFTRPLTEGQVAFDHFAANLQRFLSGSADIGEFDAWLEEVKQWTRSAQIQAEQAVDPLIDRMSFDQEKAGVLADKVSTEQAELSRALQNELPDLLDSLGVILEPRGDGGIYLVKAGDMMFVDSLPGLPPGGTLATFDRVLANRRDDVEFLHFEHRLIQNTLDVLLDEGVGKATAARWRGAPRTTVLFQFLFLLEAEGPQRLSLGRFLPVCTSILSGDLSGTVEVGNGLPGEGELPEHALERLGEEVVETLLARTADLRPQLKQKALALLEARSAELKREAVQKAEAFFETEEARLSHAQERESRLLEVAKRDLDQQREEVRSCLEKAYWRFDAVRMILCQE